MFGRPISAVFATVAFLSLLPKALADDLIVTPCVKGAGQENGCSDCDANQAITVTPWSSAANFKPIILTGAEDPNGGGGWDVWFDIPQPGDGCRVLIIEPYITDKGSVVPGVPGNVISSVAHGSCYFAHVSSRGVDAKFCCGSGDCATAGSIPNMNKRSLPPPPSRIMRDVHPGYVKREPANVEARCFVGKCDPPPPPPPGPPPYTCSTPTPTGGPFTKAGPVHVSGQQLSCGEGELCDISTTSSITVSDTLTNEQSSTSTETDGTSTSISVGWMTMIEDIGGPTFNFEQGWSHDVSLALGNSFSDSSGTSVTTSSTLTYSVKSGLFYNIWFQPVMNCQLYSLICGNAPVSITRCRPGYDDPNKQNITGLTGVMTIG